MVIQNEIDMPRIIVWHYDLGWDAHLPQPTSTLAGLWAIIEKDTLKVASKFVTDKAHVFLDAIKMHHDFTALDKASKR